MHVVCTVASCVPWQIVKRWCSYKQHSLCIRLHASGEIILMFKSVCELHFEAIYIHNQDNTVGVDKNETLVLINFSAQDASILKISHCHQQEEVLRIPKHPQHAKFGWFLAKLWHLKKNKSFPKSWSYSINFKIQVNH